MRRSSLQFGMVFLLSLGAANIAHATQNGGTISITANSSVEVNQNTALHADAIQSGDGGSITISSPNTLNFANMVASSITAIGNDTGAGGTVTIPKVGGFSIPPQQVILVNAGGNADVSVQDGTLVLNGQTCGQWKTGSGSGNTSWPRTYWNCVNPTSQASGNDAIQQSIALALVTTPANHANIQSNLDNATTSLFVFASALDWNTFFANYNNETLNESVAGYTFASTGGVPTIVTSSVFENGNTYVNGSIQYGAFTQLQLDENSAHELAHALDISQGNGLSSSYGGTPYNADQNFLNTNSIMGTSPLSPPCSLTTTAPYNNVIDASSGLAICDATTGTLAAGSPYTENTNLGIAQTADSAVFISPKEIFAEAFAWAFVLNGLSPTPWSSFYHPTADGLFANGYFNCAVVSANNSLNGTATNCP